MGIPIGESPYYVYIFEPQFAVAPYVEYFVESQLPAGYKAGGRPASRWEFNYSFSPYGRYRIGDDPRWKLRHAFEAHLVPQGAIAYEDTDCNTEGGRIRSIYFTLARGEEAGLRPLTEPYGYARFLDPGRKLCLLLERMLCLIQEYEQEGFWLVQGILAEILMLLHHSIHVEEETYLIPEIPLVSIHSDLVRRVRAYYLVHIGEEISQEALAEHLNLSSSAFYHRYRQETGEAPTITLQKMRVTLTKSLLLKGYRMSTIAKQIGFCDEFHLSKVFKRIEGISPSTFRKKAFGNK